MMKTLTVDLGARSYPIYIGTGLLGEKNLAVPHVPGEQVMIVSNTTVAPLYLAKAQAAFADFQTSSVILPDGETYKNLEVLNQIFDGLMTKRFDRQCTLVALGGGVVGDMTGFAAACFQRGVHFLQIPTTLLAQVDSSVGGKTGVNHPLGKNMIGAFYQPKSVIIDTDTLNTLDDRQLSAGLAEVVKYGLIRDPDFFLWLEAHAEDLMARDPNALAHAIEQSCLNKAQVVAEDEREAGTRAHLNLGHTFGHAIETGMGYGRTLHGEAVAIGMIVAADLSARLGWLPWSDVDRIRALLNTMNLPVHVPAEMNQERMINLMKVDKKVLSGQIRLILLKAIGQATITEHCHAERLKETLAHVRG